MLSLIFNADFETKTLISEYRGRVMDNRLDTEENSIWKLKENNI